MARKPDPIWRPWDVWTNWKAAYPFLAAVCSAVLPDLSTQFTSAPRFNMIVRHSKAPALHGKWQREEKRKQGNLGSRACIMGTVHPIMMWCWTFSSPYFVTPLRLVWSLHHLKRHDLYIHEVQSCWYNETCVGMITMLPSLKGELSPKK